MTRWPDGVQIELTTWPGMLTRAADLHPENEVVFPDGRSTYAEVERDAFRIAGRLIDAGVRRGDRVGLLVPPNLESFIGLFAIGLAGATPVPISPRYKTVELEQVVPATELSTILTTAAAGLHGDFPAVLNAAFPELARHGDGDLALDSVPTLKRILLLDGPEQPGMRRLDAVAVDRPADRHDVAVRATGVRVSDTAVILFTSGTSAAPKGCVITHESISRQAHSLSSVHMLIAPEDSVASPLPLFHIAGVAIMSAALFAGAKYCHSSFMEPGDAVAQLSDEHVTHWQPAFDTIFKPIIEHPDFSRETVPDLRVMICAGTTELINKTQAQLDWVTIISNYGSTECVGSVTMPNLTDSQEVRIESSGHLLPGVEMRLMDLVTGEPVGPGAVGEVQVRGPQIFSGYYRDDEANAAAFAPGNWFRTGDLGVFNDQGKLQFRGRVKDMLKVGGENVAAVEVESYLVRHPDVRIVSVVGAPDPKYGEVPVAYVELVPGSTLTESELIAFCTGRIASYKVPRHIRFVTEWPMSGTKIRKTDLRDLIAHELTGPAAG